MKTKTPLTHEALNAMPLHKLLAIGLRDLHKHELTPGCKVDMGLWLHTRDDGTCIACLAGSVLRYEFGFSDLLDAWNEAAADRWSKALNCLRFGGVGGALGTLGRDPILGYQLDRVVTQYRIDRDGFWRDMRRLWRDLKEAGL